jgi:hypothetical protein
MKPSFVIVGALLGLAFAGGAGGYWYMAPAENDSAKEVQREDSTFIDMERKFVVPLVRGNRVRSLLVVGLQLEVTSSAETKAQEFKPKIRDLFLDTLFAMAVAGSFDGDLYSNNVQSEMRARLLEAATQVLQDDVKGILIGELLRQDQ